MDMVRHKAIAVEAERIARFRLGDSRQERMSVVVVEEDVGTVIAAIQCVKRRGAIGIR